MLSDYSDVLGVNHDNPEPITDLKAGELVSVGLSSHPTWKVIAVHEGQCWMYRTDAPWQTGIGQIARLRRVLQVVEQGAAA